ncbi:MAG TPA: 1,4-alpha-glucan branching protein GlgB [Candidatus Limnocylindria bacterium]|nr:1,4-alpha-glucan branching protein GlgB [Candidatus Limnocylindria bacterium]
MTDTRAAASPAPDADAVARLLAGEGHDPHAVLGVHAADGGAVVRAFHPDATDVELLPSGGQPLAMAALGGGLWGAFVDGAQLPLAYRLRFGFVNGETWERDDPYRFAPTLGELDLHLIGEGTHERLWEVLGAHPRTVDGTAGVAFAAWAPNARSVRLVGDFDRWDGRLLPMRSLGGSGVWELFVPGIGHGELYKYEVVGRDGKLRLKADPLGFSMQVRPETASRVWDLDADARHWTDQAWMEERARGDPYRSPMAIYEVHLGSWMRNPDGSWLGYRQAGERLAEHCRRYGFTHVELLPVAEHPFDGSWGYQVTGYYAPTARFGSPDDFRAMVDTLHNAGIGVIVDWVPAHFPTDEFALRQFDGTPLYEHPDPRLGEHPDWGTLIFDFGRPEVRNFLVANALFWLDRYHVDGLRVDAVASMLYLDYSRKAGEWAPNRYGGNENLEAIAFLREMNERVYRLHPGAVTIAEESTAFPGVSRPTYLGGLGFGFKWDMGWMHDTLAYLREDPVHRRDHHDKLTFRGLYLHTEHFVLPLSHDEVVHGKGSLLRKMPGDEWQRFANLRALLAQMYTQPGKKLLFMGTELAPDTEWDHDQPLPWEIGEDGLRAAFGRYLADLGTLYRSTPALWAADPEPDAFAWIDASDVESSVYSYLRRAGDEVAAVVLNMTPVPRDGYRLGLPSEGSWDEALNSDSEHYGGSNVGNLGGVVADPMTWHGQPASALLTLPPLGAVILRHRPPAPQPPPDSAEHRRVRA